MPDDIDPTPTYYFDSCVFIDLIEHPETQEPAKTIAAMLDSAASGDCRIITSLITMVEVLWAKHELDKHKVDAKVEAKILSLWHPTASPVKVIEVHELIARDALKLMRDGLTRKWSKTKGNDAIHLITAKREKADEFITTESAMEKWGKLLGFKVSKPHLVAPQKPPQKAVASPATIQQLKDSIGLFAQMPEQQNEGASAGAIAEGGEGGRDEGGVAPSSEEVVRPGLAESDAEELCDHPRLTREVVGAQKSGDWVCADCGETLSPEEARALIATREK